MRLTHERKREAGWQPCIKCRKVKAAALLLCLMLTFMAVTVSANTEACVIYEGSAKRFLWISDSEYGENDLFGGFKGVMPGDRLTQEIKVSNARENGVKAILYLRAEPVDEAYRDFLSQLTLTVWTEEQTILAQGPADQSTELSERICLGTFYAGAETTLKISLEVPESLDNSYRITLEKIRVLSVPVIVTPSDSTVFLTDADGKRVTPKQSGIYNLLEGRIYRYTVTKSGYIGVSGIWNGDAQEICIVLQEAAENPDIDVEIPSSWPAFRGDRSNNGVVDAPVPKKADDAVLYWATKLGDGYGSNATGSPIIVDDYIVCCAARYIYKMDRYTGEIVQRGEMAEKSSFNIIPPVYAEGLIFVGLSGGTVQAFNADTLESVWIYRDALGGQPNSPLVYHDGYVYTGFWNGEQDKANFVCISVTDEDSENPTEEKLAAWTYSQEGGFYWAGAYVCDQFILVGTDDGYGRSDGGTYVDDTSSLLSLSPETGLLIDKISGLRGDIRSSVAFDEVSGRYYFVSKGGSFYSVAVNADGTFKKSRNSETGYDLKEIRLDNGSGSDKTPAMSTSTPVIHNGRAYIGVSGTGQFTEYSGHNITVIDLASWEIAYKVPTKGYPQTSGLLTCAYEDEEGYAYIYFIDNYTPGQIRVIKDKPGITAVVGGVTETYKSRGQTVSIEGCAPVLFTPSSSQAQYAICSPIADSEGTLYFKNDSAYMMAVGSRIDRIEISEMPSKTLYTGSHVIPFTPETLSDVLACAE